MPKPHSLKDCVEAMALIYDGKVTVFKDSSVLDILKLVLDHRGDGRDPEPLSEPQRHENASTMSDVGYLPGRSLN